MDPGNVLFIGLLFGTLLLWTKWVRIGKTLCLLSCVYFLIVGVLPVGTFLLDILEQRFSKPDVMPQHVDGIVVLGGVVNIKKTVKTQQLSLMKTRERVDVLPELTKRYPKAKVLFTSGSAELVDNEVKEADLIKPYLEKIVADPSKLIFENQSRNTIENVINSKKLVKPQKGETWLLVTSASHMPRSVGIFRKQGWDVTPYPVNYVVGNYYLYDIEVFLRKGLTRLRTPLHEWLGLLAYYLTGKTSAFFPAP
ncbi:YdcF family protein [Terasakiella sp. SH-1]|uniref:YdcF family protein n=1 Tax=Terasakiella sp. SH-1 TaxID=2560057 RepID=UPI00142F5211|nr:YdcF family protein [Terasakiella sp. SH-1]